MIIKSEDGVPTYFLQMGAECSAVWHDRTDPRWEPVRRGYSAMARRAARCQSRKRQGRAVRVVLHDQHARVLYETTQEAARPPALHQEPRTHLLEVYERGASDARGKVIRRAPPMTWRIEETSDLREETIVGKLGLRKRAYP